MKFIGQNVQAIEYLEFLKDDPPVTEGFNKLHVLALLTIVYEHTEGDKYVIATRNMYKEFQSEYVVEIIEKLPLKLRSKALTALTASPVSESAEIWQQLIIQVSRIEVSCFLMKCLVIPTCNS